MQRRVIKVNLMALILIVLLIISAIVCGIIFIPKLINKSKQNNEEQLSNNQIDENKEEKISFYNQGKDEEFIAKTHKGEAGYIIKYDKNNFTIEHSNVNGAYYSSSMYKGAIIEIYVEKGDFDKKIAEVSRSNASYNMPNNPASRDEIFEYNVTDTRLNSSIEHAVKQHLKTNDSIEQRYYIKGNDHDFYVIQLSCPTEYENEIFPIMEEMVKTFQIL